MGWLAIGWTRGDAGVHHAPKMQQERPCPGRGQECALTRRTFVKLATLGAFTTTSGCAHRPGRVRNAEPRLLFTSAGKTCLVRSDGTGLRTLEFAVPNQATWQPAGFFSDGRLLPLSMEPRRDGPGRPFAEYYHQTPTHLWIYDLERDTLTEIASRDRLAVFYTPALLVGDDRLLVQVVRDQGGQIFSMNRNGSDPRLLTQGLDERGADHPRWLSIP
jgi:hypothetical protein